MFHKPNSRYQSANFLEAREMKAFFEICLDLRMVAVEIAGLAVFVFLLWRVVHSEWKKTRGSH
jgi:hypothetical protein